MTQPDFEFCRFIDKELCFVTIPDFYRNRKILKFFYNNLDNDAKLFYKWYVYANVFIDESSKNIIWEYLNNAEIEHELRLYDLYKKYNNK